MATPRPMGLSFDSSPLSTVSLPVALLPEFTTVWLVTTDVSVLFLPVAASGADVSAADSIGDISLDEVVCVFISA